MKKLITLLFISVSTICTQAQVSPLVYSMNGNKIVFLDRYYSDYLTAMKADYANKDKYYRDKIATPIMNYFSKSIYSDIVGVNFFSPIGDTSNLQSYIDAIKNNEAKIETIIMAALADCNKNLKDDSITIYVQPSTYHKKMIMQKMGGITAVTGDAKQILLTVDPSIDNWADLICYNVTHEFEHAYWTQMHQHDTDQFTMLAYLMFEGRADSYAHFVYPDKKAPWTSSLPEKDKADLWTKIKPQLNSVDQMFERGVMFGSASYPLWGGYNLGYAIVQSALKNNPQLTPVQWANLKPAEILKMSDYK